MSRNVVGVASQNDSVDDHQFYGDFALRGGVCHHLGVKVVGKLRDVTLKRNNGTRQ